jgi:formylglycine-generating enzyme
MTRVWLLMLLTSCTLKLDFDGLAGGSAACPSGRGPAMISAGSFCIDATEVTNAHYALFLAEAANKPPEQHKACGFNTDLTPTAKWPATEPKNPVGDVDWCDAWAYCKWAGKRLCGAIGGGPARYDQPESLSSQWYFACTRGVGPTRRYPYGADYRAGICRGDAGESAGPRPVGESAACVGGFDGLLDMSGNVWEWEDACTGDTGASDTCAFRGGSWGSSSSLLACNGRSPTELFKRSDTREKLGIRCCSP